MSLQNSWKYYEHAFLPAVSPHEKPDLSPVLSGEIWKYNNRALFARWSEDYDCGTETEWWYCIKDNPFDISALKSNRRYKITKGLKNFNVSTIVPSDYPREIVEIYAKAYTQYPRKYRPKFDAEKTMANMSAFDGYVVFGAFDKVTGELEGFALMNEHKNWTSIVTVKVNPEKEKLNINAALIWGICEHYNNKLSNNFYICDGERNVLHETNFQDYLMRYFGFRRAYCRLRIKYRPGFGFIIKILYAFRFMVKWLDFIPVFCKVSALLEMEKIRRKCESRA